MKASASLLNGIRSFTADLFAALRTTTFDNQVHGVRLPLVCLTGINGFNFTTDRMEDLEPNGWIASLVFPMASNLQFVFYRRDLNDRDILFKVLLNEREATLPLPADKAPYYHWNDFREHYLNILDADRKRKK